MNNHEVYSCAVFVTGENLVAWHHHVFELPEYSHLREDCSRLLTPRPGHISLSSKLLAESGWKPLALGDLLHLDYDVEGHGEARERLLCTAAGFFKEDSELLLRIPIDDAWFGYRFKKKDVLYLTGDVVWKMAGSMIHRVPSAQEDS